MSLRRIKHGHNNSAPNKSVGMYEENKDWIKLRAVVFKGPVVHLVLVEPLQPDLVPQDREELVKILHSEHTIRINHPPGRQADKIYLLAIEIGRKTKTE